MSAAKISAPDHNTVRIFFSTDNHLGYQESDPIRGLDSFLAFEEVLKRSNEVKADMLLLGGDLFHDNKPSRRSMVKCMELLRTHCMGDSSISLVPRETSAMGSGYSTVNYMDPNLNISLPVFIIHGNHDDPSGDGQYSALDLLSTCGLINYFGKQERIDDIHVRPLLLTKGTARIAIFGLGNIRDERLQKTFEARKVRWLRPPDEDGLCWFNILVIHQNKVEHNVKNSINFEKHIPDWFDFVIWGHEHECLIDPQQRQTNQEGQDGNTWVSQPGSTVATSLIAGEAKRKHAGWIDIQCQRGAPPRFKFSKYALRASRPFVYDEIQLQGSGCGPNESDVRILLMERVKELIEQASKERQDTLADLQLPIIRIKVEHTGFPALHVQRFGQIFAGDHPRDWKVANPFEIISFWRRRRVIPRNPGAPAGEDEDGADPRAVLMLEAPEMDDLVDRELEASKDRGTLEILAKSDIYDAVYRFVNKEENKAIQEMLEQSLKEVLEEFRRDVGNRSNPLSSADDADQLSKLVAGRLQDRRAQKDKVSASARVRRAGAGAGESLNQLSANLSQNAASQAEYASHSTAGRASTATAANDDDSGDGVPDSQASVGGRGRGRGMSRGKVVKAGRGSASAETAGRGTRQIPLYFQCSQGAASASQAAPTSAVLAPDSLSGPTGSSVPARRSARATAKAPPTYLVADSDGECGDSSAVAATSSRAGRQGGRRAEKRPADSDSDRENLSREALSARGDDEAGKQKWTKKRARKNDSDEEDLFGVT